MNKFLTLLCIYQTIVMANPVLAKSTNPDSSSKSVCSDSFNQGILYYNNKDYAGAVNSFNTEVKTNPNNSSAIYYLGLCYQALKRYDLAAFNYNKVIELAPNTQASKLAKLAIKQLDLKLSQKQVVNYSPNIPTSKMPNKSKAKEDDKLPDYLVVSFNYNSLNKQNMVEALINGVTAPCIINPGIKGVILSQSQLDNLGLTVKPAKKYTEIDSIGSQDKQRAQVTYVSLNLGQLEMNNIEAYIVEKTPYDYPIIGDVFSKNYYLSVDNSQSQIKFFKKGTRIPEGFDIPFQYVKNKIVINVDLNMVSTPMQLDPMSPGLSFTMEQARQARVFIPRTNRFQKTNGLSGYGEGSIGYLDFVKLGPIQASNVQVVVRPKMGDLPAFGQSLLNGWEYLILNDRNIIRLISH